MSPSRSKSITLLELIISLCIVGLLALAFSNLDTFTRYQVMSSDRKAKLQNDAAYVLEHMAKHLSKAIGNAAQDAVVVGAISGDNSAVRVWIDSSLDGQRSDITDSQIAYRYHRIDPKYEIWYCPACADDSCNSCNPAWPESGNSDNILSKSIKEFNLNDSADYIDVTITTCWDPKEASSSCGTPDNPSVTLQNRINLPSVSTH